MFFYRFFAFAGLLGLTLSLDGGTPAAASIVIDFDSVDTSSLPSLGVDPTSYLAGFGVTLANVTSTTTMGIKNPTFDTNLILVSNPNYMSQWWNSINGVSYDLMFDQPLESLNVAIPEITSGVIVPAWSFTAIDAGGTPLVTSYGQTELSGESARRTFDFLGATNPGLQGIRVYSNVLSSAGMGGIPIDDIVFTQAVPEPSSLALSLLGLFAICFGRRKRK
jgi:hypothetical protein